jgi:hypothetical protein
VQEWLVADETKDERIERRRRAVALIGALHAKDDAKAEALIAELSQDDDLRRVIGSLGVAGSTLLENLSKVKDVPADDLIKELEEGLVNAPVE